jgi:hypothetical protein
VGDKYPGAHDAEQRGECFQHDNDPCTQRPQLTACDATQSKQFRGQANFESGLMISCNTGVPNLAMA